MEIRDTLSDWKVCHDPTYAHASSAQPGLSLIRKLEYEVPIIHRCAGNVHVLGNLHAQHAEFDRRSLSSALQ